MAKVSMIGLDLAKNVFQVHGADASGACVFRRRLRRAQVLEFFAKQPPATVVMEACAGAHYWSREIAKLGHDARQIAPAYAKPFVKRGKNDAIDAEAMVEAGQRPNMRFVPVKSEEKQASAVVFRIRDTFVRQRTQLINALRGHLGEYGFTAPQGAGQVKKLMAAVADPNARILDEARECLTMLVGSIERLSRKIAELDAKIAKRAKRDATARRLKTIDGVGPIIATATEALAPPAETFKRGRDFAAWVGITPLQHASGGKERIGKTSKKGCKTLRRLFILGAASVVRQAVRKGATDPWLSSMLARKPRQLVIVALANKMARIIWALLAKGGVYRAPVAAA